MKSLILFSSIFIASFSFSQSIYFKTGIYQVENSSIYQLVDDNYLSPSISLGYDGYILKKEKFRSSFGYALRYTQNYYKSVFSNQETSEIYNANYIYLRFPVKIMYSIKRLNFHLAFIPELELMKKVDSEAHIWSYYEDIVSYENSINWLSGSTFSVSFGLSYQIIKDKLNLGLFYEYSIKNNQSFLIGLNYLLEQK